MNRGTTQGIGMRAAIAVVALYALVLQAFVAGMLPISPAQGHDLAAICAPSADSDGSTPDHARHDCCLATCASHALPAPPLVSLGAAWPVRDARIVVFTAAESILPTGPPRGPHSPRGPPTA